MSLWTIILIILVIVLLGGLSGIGGGRRFGIGWRRATYNFPAIPLAMWRP
jgi:hypothetical protein